MIDRAALVILEWKGKFLLQLRDNNPKIFSPNMWGLFGGEIEKTETPKEGAIREISEELEVEDEGDLILKEIQLLCEKEGISSSTKKVYFFYSKLKINPKLLILHEGQKIGIFSLDEIKKMDNIPSHHKGILNSLPKYL